MAVAQRGFPDRPGPFGQDGTPVAGRKQSDRRAIPPALPHSSGRHARRKRRERRARRPAPKNPGPHRPIMIFKKRTHLRVKLRSTISTLTYRSDGHGWPEEAPNAERRLRKVCGKDAPRRLITGMPT